MENGSYPVVSQSKAKISRNRRIDDGYLLSEGQFRAEVTREQIRPIETVRSSRSWRLSFPPTDRIAATISSSLGCCGVGCA